MFYILVSIRSWCRVWFDNLYAKAYSKWTAECDH